MTLPIVPTAFAIIIGLAFLIFFLLKKNALQAHTEAIGALPEKNLGLWIALAAGLGLFAELMIIRLHSSYFHVFAYFKNVSLLSCFLGLGIGYALNSRRQLTTPLFLPLLGIQIIILFVLRYTPLSYFLQNPIPENLVLGVDHMNRETLYTLITYIFLISVFSFNAFCFIPLGQLAARLMLRQNPLTAYGWNLVGSLVGIIAFSLLSFTWTPPYIWVSCLALGLLLYFGKNPRIFLSSVCAAVFILLFLARPPSKLLEVYSPYQVLTVFMTPDNYPMVGTNNVYYQRILDLRPENIDRNPKLKPWSEYYNLPYTIKPEPENVLIVGSGTGNDVAAALRNHAKAIDAVEIDPAILELGKRLHRERPYQEKNVNITVDDARAFIKNTNKRYDLIVYGLLDSHTLLSSKSGGIRLDSYIYTVEGLREARKKLKNDGVICLTFCILRPELGRKLFLMLQEAFDGQKPMVYQAIYDGGYAFLAGNSVFSRSTAHHPTLNEVTSTFDDNSIRADKSTDDWPFLYMPVRKYPLSYLIMIVLLVIVSTVFVQRSLPGTIKSFSIPCFFLGSGFMLVETKSITELALVYGSTWIVISIVIACILLMAYCANWIVSRTRSVNMPASYAMLLLSLIIGYAITFTSLSSSSPWISKIIMPLLLTLPLFFSGIIFSTEIKRTNSIATALSSNLIGAMLGGFLEYNSMFFGFRSLYLFALVMYALAFLGSVMVTRTK